ncbi:MAG TPA: pullulanase-associated domain-containing protein, partial [Elusimicrobiales bacterium]|nr:pullulanase-associated domain-containing protein [Elusimicrobiales bacterium]
MSGKVLSIHYNRLRGDHDGWTLWVWNAVPGAEGFALEPSGSDAFGPVFLLDLEAAGLEGAAVGFLPRFKNWENKDAPDRILERALPGELWLVEGDPRLHASQPPVSPELESALLDGPGLVRFIFNRRVDREFVLSLDPRASGPDRSCGPLSAEISGDTALGRAALVAFEGLGSPDPGELN